LRLSRSHTGHGASAASGSRRGRSAGCRGPRSSGLVSDHEQLTCAELSRLVRPCGRHQARQVSPRWSGVVRRPGLEPAFRVGVKRSRRTPLPATGARVFGALSLGEGALGAVAALAGLGCRTPVDLRSPASTVGSGPRTDAERHTCRSQGEPLLPGASGSSASTKRASDEDAARTPERPAHPAAAALTSTAGGAGLQNYFSHEDCPGRYSISRSPTALAIRSMSSIETSASQCTFSACRASSPDDQRARVLSDLASTAARTFRYRLYVVLDRRDAGADSQPALPTFRREIHVLHSMPASLNRTALKSFLLGIERAWTR